MMMKMRTMMSKSAAYFPGGIELSRKNSLTIYPTDYPPKSTTFAGLKNLTVSK